MASVRKRLPDKRNTKFYKCHPKTPVATVICIVCGNAYHYSDIDKIDNKIDEDKEEEIYLSETAKIIIAHIKMRQTNEIRREILEELAGETVEVQSATKDKVSLNEVMVAENTLLKQLNKELQDKNKLLHELLENYKKKVIDNQFTKKSFAEVTKEKKIQIQPKKVPKIVVKIGKCEQ